jgi:hypothetical protein
MGETSSIRRSGDRQACVLVVEDDPALQRMILDYFVENNIRTLVASDRREMVSKLGCIEVNLVILDLRLGQGRRSGFASGGSVEFRRAGYHHYRSPPRRHRSGRRARARRRRLCDEAVQSARIARARARGVTTVRDRRRRSGAQSRARSLSIFRLAARPKDPAAHRPRRRSGSLDQGRVCIVACLSRCAPAPT